MRIYPHKPLESNWSRQYASSQASLLPRAEVTDEAITEATNPTFLRVNATTALSCAHLAYGLEESTETVHGFFRDALYFFDAMLRFGQQLSVVDASQALSSALVLGDDVFAKRIVSLPRQRYTHPEVMAPEVLYCAFELEMALVRKDRDEARRLAETVQLALQAKGTLPALVREVKPLLALEVACMDANETAWVDASRLRSIAFERKFRQPELQNDASGAFDLRALGLTRIARRAGIPGHFESVYFPRDLLDGR